MLMPTLPTLLEMFYTFIDSVAEQIRLPKHPTRGRPPKWTHSQVLFLCLLTQVSFQSNESAMLRFVRANWTEFFGPCLSQPQFNRRAQRLEVCMISLFLLAGQRACELLELLDSFKEPELKAFEFVDGMGIPLKSVARGHRDACFRHEADFGSCGVPRRPIYGFKAAVAVHAKGPITGVVIGPASSQERYLFEALVRFRQDAQAPAVSDTELGKLLSSRHRPAYPGHKGPKGPLDVRGVGQWRTRYYMGDKGYSGKKWKAHWDQEYSVGVLTPNDCNTMWERRWLKSKRQRVETVIGAVGGGEKQRPPRARSYSTANVRIYARLAAFNLRCLFNAALGLPTLCHLDPLAMNR